MSQAILKAADLRKHFTSRGVQVEAVKGVSLSLHAGEVLAFLGPNGAGKTTTIRILTGLVHPDEGTVLIDGRDPATDAAALQIIGTVLEGNRNLYWRLTPLENLQYFAALKGMRARDAKAHGRALLDRFGLSAKERAPVQTLSRGMQQKVAIAVALVHHPRVLLLDEPTLGLDVEAAQEVKALVRAIVSEGCAVLLTTHQLDVAEELSDRTSIINNGEVLYEQPTRELIRRFSGESYTITLDDEPGEAHVRAVEKAGGLVVERGHVLFRGSVEGLYAVLAALRPLSIVKVEKDDANLTDVFLKLIKDTRLKERQADADFIRRGAPA